MPGRVNYFYNAGILPTHTKTFFNSSKVLTVQNIILKNIIIFFNKVYYNPYLLPISVLQTIPSDSPSPTNPTDHTSDWYLKYNSNPYNMSTFFKGPLLSNTILTENTQFKNTNDLTFKRTLKLYLIARQSLDNPAEWGPNNFSLFHIPGLRRSDRIKNLIKIDYT